MSEPTEPAATGPAPSPVPVPLDPTAIWAVPPHLAQPVRRKRPWVRTALRWSTAVLVCVAAGTGTAFGVMAPSRTDLPGLKTPADGRYVFPALTLPPLPPRALGPDAGYTANQTRTHLADLRRLLLPAPVGGRPDAGYPGVHGWYPVGSLTKKFANGADLGDSYAELGLRHIAATAWTAPDGTRAEIYLLAFRSSPSTSTRYDADISYTHLTTASHTSIDNSPVLIGLNGTESTLQEQAAQGGEPATRLAFLVNGEVEALVVMTNPKAVSPASFQQVVTLQSELLQG